MTTILGISAYYHDSAAALIVDGRIVAAAQEERFTRVKHDPRFPSRAIEYCLGEGAVTPDRLDYVGFYDKPILKFERLLETYLAFAPAGYVSFAASMPLWLREKLYMPRMIRRELGNGYRRGIVFAEHHESHAASAFFPSPFEEAAILTLDGVGEWATTSLGIGRGNRIELTHDIRFPHSLGLLYSAFTYFTGFRVNSGEYKLMGLAPYGEPVYYDTIMRELVDVKDDGSFRMDMRYFNYCQGLTMTNRRFARLFGGPARAPEGPLTQREMDLAASVQKVTEEIMLRCARHAHAVTGMRDLCLAGGVALNCVANGRLLREGPFDRIWIQPAAGDAGGALGVALLIWHQLLGNEREPEPEDSQRGSLLGPAFDEAHIKAFLERKGIPYQHFESEDELAEAVARLIASEQVVGWFQGRLEFGPRALGSRSILGDARSKRMQSVMNLKIKFRESFRPFAPSVLAERADDYFEMTAGGVGGQSPYMLLVADVRESRRVRHDGSDDVSGLDRLKVVRSEVPAITHVDDSARIQTVDEHRHGRYHKLLRAFERLTGCPVVINTSFNVRGEPIVCAPEHAYRCFMGTNMDALVLERFLVRKREQPDGNRERNEEYLRQFELDSTPPARSIRMVMIDINVEPTRRDLWIFALLWAVLVPVAGWVLVGMGTSLLVLGGIASLCLALSLAFNREQSRRSQLAGVLLPIGAIVVWATVRIVGGDGDGRGVAHGALFGVFLAAGLSGGAVAMLSRRFGTTLYRWWMMAVLPIGWTVSHVLLGIAFFGVIMPIGLALRMGGQDLLRLRRGSEAPTYWNARPRAPEGRRYFRQF